MLRVNDSSLHVKIFQVSIFLLSIVSSWFAEAIVWAQLPLQSPPPSQNLEIEVYRKATHEIPDSIDTNIVHSDAQMSVVNLVFDGLVRVQQDLTIVPNLAEKWNISEGGKQYVFHLKRHVRFHNGSLLTPAAVVASLERSMHLRTPARFVFSRVQRISYDSNANTVIVVLREAFPAILGLLASSVARISSLDEETGLRVGTGPFMFGKRYSTGLGHRVLQLHRFENYHGGKPLIKILEFWEVTDDEALKLASAGFLHDTALLPLEGRNSQIGRHSRQIEYHPASTWLFSMNSMKGRLASSALRKCLVEAFPQQEFIETFIPQHMPAAGYVPPRLPGYNATLVPQQKRFPRSCTRFKGVVLVLDYPSVLVEGKTMCELVATTYRKWDIIIECRGLSLDALFSRMETREADLSFFAMQLDYPVAESYFWTFEVGAGWKVSNYTSKKVDGLMFQSRIASNEDQQEFLKQINTHLYNNYVTINLSYPTHFIILHICVDGFHVDLAGFPHIRYDLLSLSESCPSPESFSTVTGSLYEKILADEEAVGEFH